MEYLKLFESVNVEEYINELEEKTQIKIIKDEIDDLFLDLKDDLLDIQFNNDLRINLTYKRKNIRVSRLSYTYYLEFLKTRQKFYSTEINYLKDFLEKCEISTKMNMEYGVKLYLQFNNPEDLLTLKEKVENIELASKSLGYNFYINDSSEMGMGVKDVNKSIDDIINNQTVKDWEIKLQNRRKGHTTIFLLFECDLDSARFKNEIDFDSQIPSNIISDFNTFVDKYRIPSKDKQELINIIKKGNWNEEKILNKSYLNT